MQPVQGVVCFVYLVSLVHTLLFRCCNCTSKLNPGNAVATVKIKVTLSRDGKLCRHKPNQAKPQLFRIILYATPCCCQSCRSRQHYSVKRECLGVTILRSTKAHNNAADKCHASAPLCIHVYECHAYTLAVHLQYSGDKSSMHPSDNSAIICARPAPIAAKSRAPGSLPAHLHCNSSH